MNNLSVRISFKKGMEETLASKPLATLMIYWSLILLLCSGAFRYREPRSSSSSFPRRAEANVAKKRKRNAWKNLIASGRYGFNDRDLIECLEFGPWRDCETTNSRFFSSPGDNDRKYRGTILIMSKLPNPYDNI